jgi:ankyrin repeat protein
VGRVSLRPCQLRLIAGKLARVSCEPPDPDLVEFATRLFNLARHGDSTRLAAYLDAGVSPDLANDKGESLLMLAAYHGHVDAVCVLLGRGADPNRANDRGQTPLAGAVFKAEPEVIQTLVAAGADPDAGQPSALDTARLFERQDLAQLLRPVPGSG